MMLSGHKKCLESVLYSVDRPQWVNGCKVPDFNGIFGQLNCDIETWLIMQKRAKLSKEFGGI